MGCGQHQIFHRHCTYVLYLCPNGISLMLCKWGAACRSDDIWGISGIRWHMCLFNSELILVVHTALTICELKITCGLVFAKKCKIVCCMRCIALPWHMWARTYLRCLGWVGDMDHLLETVLTWVLKSQSRKYQLLLNRQICHAKFISHNMKCHQVLLASRGL